MSLPIGTRLGQYEVTAPLGAGGMGEVFRARDTKLGRDVALKVLPAAYASHPDRLSRFRREAQILAALSHPNIGAIFGLEEAGGTTALVLELVEGPTLAEKLAGSGLPALGSGPGNAQSPKPTARERFPLPTRSRLPARSLKRWKPRITRASCIAISSPPISRSRTMAG